LTLALIELFILAIGSISSSDLAVPTAAFFVGLGYVAALQIWPNFEEYLLRLDSTRVGFLDSNREGIFSTFGYLFIFGLTYLVGRFFAPLVLWDDLSVEQSKEPNAMFCLVRNVIVQGLVYLLALHYIGQPSRRVANLVYGLHIHCAVTVIVLFIHIVQHRVGRPKAGASPTTQLPTLHSAIYRHGSSFFLAANLLTGFLNIFRSSISTPFLEFFSLTVYMFVLCSASLWRLNREPRINH